MLMPLSVYALTTFNYEGDVTTIDEYDGTNRITNAGFSLGDTFSITLQFDETAANTATQDYLGNYSAIENFTISNSEYTTTGISSSPDVDIIVWDNISPSNVDSFTAFSDFNSSPYIPGLGNDRIYLRFKDNSSAHDNTIFGSTGLPIEPLDPNNFAYASAIIEWTEWVDEEYDWIYNSLYISNLRVVNNSVPEPATMLLLGFGLMCLAGIRRKLQG